MIDEIDDFVWDELRELMASLPRIPEDDGPEVPPFF